MQVTTNITRYFGYSIPEVGVPLVELAPGSIGIRNLMSEITNDIVELSQKLVPVATGRLKNSIKYSESYPVYSVSYNTQYALYTHEDLNKYHRGKTQAKYLEHAVIIVLKSQFVENGGRLPDFDVIFDYTQDYVKVSLIVKPDSTEGGSKSWKKFL